jgi:hypothetical protein
VGGWVGGRTQHSRMSLSFGDGGWKITESGREFELRPHGTCLVALASPSLQVASSVPHVTAWPPLTKSVNR